MLLFCFCPSNASIEAFLAAAQSQSEALQSIDVRIQALQTEIEGRDLVLSSQLSLNAENFNNDQDAVMFARRSRTRFVDLTLTQPFSTGTLLAFNTGHERSVIDNFGLRQIADWEVRLTQSLWRDGFGRSTSLRHRAEKEELASRRAALVFEKQRLLIQLEGFYWDYVTLKHEEKIRSQNLQTSRELLNWTQQRKNKLAAEKSDLLQAQALHSGRELDLISVQNRLAALTTRLKSVFPDLNIEQYAPSAEYLDKERPLMTLVSTTDSGSPTNTTPVRWDTLSSVALSEQAELESKQAREQLKPLFDVYMSYGQNGIADTFQGAWSRAGQDRFSGTRVGVLVQVPLHRGLTSKVEKAALLQAEARKLEARAQRRDSEMSWLDLERQQKVLQAQTKEAAKLSEFQTQKVVEERRRLKIGRSTLFQLVSFEVEEAEASVRKFTFLAELHKLESQARLFTTQGSLK